MGREFTRGGGFQFWIDRFLAEGAYPFMVPVLEKFVLPHATAMAFFVAYGELAIGLALVLGILVRPASICGAVYMLTLLFSSNHPGSHAPFWQYFGASLDHSVWLFVLQRLSSGMRIESSRFDLTCSSSVRVGKLRTLAQFRSPKTARKNSSIYTR